MGREVKTFTTEGTGFHRGRAARDALFGYSQGTDGVESSAWTDVGLRVSGDRSRAGARAGAADESVGTRGTGCRERAPGSAGGDKER